VRTLIIATGPRGGGYEPLGEALARTFTDQIPGLQARAQVTAGGVFNVDAVQDRGADLAFTQGDTAYSALRHGTRRDPRPHLSLRALAVLYTSALQIVARRDGDIRSVRGLKGRRVGMGPTGSGTEVAARVVLQAHGLAASDCQAVFVPFDEASALMEEGRLDADFVMASHPAAAVTEADRAVGVRLLSVEPGAVPWIRERFPFYRPATIPGATYRGQAEEVQTLGVDNILVCRADMDAELARRLTEALLQALPELSRRYPSARGIDPERAPAAPIPLHPGAARFYREQELLR
jgi:TRAP transporter TAXI family solute receptor